MLQYLHDRLKGVFTWILVISISFIFLISGMSLFFKYLIDSSSYVAKVGNYEINYQQFYKYAKDAKTKEQKNEVLSQMINEYLILVASRKNIIVSKLALKSAIFNNPMFFDKDGKFSSNKLKQVIDYFGGIDSLEKLISQNIQVTIIPQTINHTSFITDYEKKIFSNIYSGNKQIDYIRINPSSLKKLIKLNPTQKELEKYYIYHKNEYITPEIKNISYFIISNNYFLSKEKISDDISHHYFNTHIDLFKKSDDNSKHNIFKIIQNRKILEQFHLYSDTVDSIQFSKLEHKLGQAKKRIIINNNSVFDGVKNNLFFINNHKYGSIPILNNKFLVYRVDSSILATQQEFSQVKDIVTKLYFEQKYEELAKQKARKLLEDLKSGKKLKHIFNKTTISSEFKVKNLSEGFTNYVLSKNNQYDIYQDKNNDIYIYKVLKVSPMQSYKNNNIDNQLKKVYEEGEKNFYLQSLKKEISVKVNYKNI